MTVREYYKEKIPCNNCIHQKVCNVKRCFEETEIKTTHPYVDVILKCTEFITKDTIEIDKDGLKIKHN